MVIKNIDYTEERRKKEEKKEENSKEQKGYKKLSKEFNEKAKELNINYKIGMIYKYPHLLRIKKRKLLIWNWEEDEELNQIYHDDGKLWKDGEYFSFINGLDSNVFKEIEGILNNINIEFEVKLKGGKIPAKYKILEDLK